MHVYCDGISYQEIFELIRLFFPQDTMEQCYDKALVDHQSFLCVEYEEKTKMLTMELNGEKETVKPEEHPDIAFKNQVKKQIYRFLHNKTGISLPWGILTGVRPVKIVTDYLLKGKTVEEMDRLLTEEYLIEKKKALLALYIGQKELAFLTKEHLDKISLYIGIPFCPSVCSYCSFGSIPLQGKEELLKAYFIKLLEEIKIVGSFFQKLGKQVDTIYVGGGTPSVLSSEQIEKMFQYLDSYFLTENVSEITFEGGRPETLDKDKLMTLSSVGVNRLSINPQTMNNKTLKRVGRFHTAEEIENAYIAARNIGFEAINMDLILGLPGETLKDIKNTLKRLEKLDPENITIHTLALKRGAKISEFYTDSQVIDSMMDYAIKKNMENGSMPYYLYRQKNMTGNLENIGFTKPGKEGVYNIEIMEEKQTIIALGSGGISKIVFPDTGRIERVANYKDVYLYTNQFDKLMEKKLSAFNAFYAE